MSELLNIKLSDQILTKGVQIHESWGPRVEPAFSSEETRLISVIRRSPIFYIQNVVDYLFTYYGQEWGASELPNVTPPFPSFFTEFKLKDVTASYQAGFRRAGVLFEASKPEPAPQNVVAINPTVQVSSERWGLQATVIAETSGVNWALSRYTMSVADNGTLTEESGAHLLSERLGGISNYPREVTTEILQSGFSEFIFPGLLAINFTNTKGAVIREEEAHKRKTGQPLVKYHIIDTNQEELPKPRN